LFTVAITVSLFSSCKTSPKIPVGAEVAEANGFMVFDRGVIEAGSAGRSYYWLLGGDEDFAELRRSLEQAFVEDGWNVAPPDPTSPDELAASSPESPSCVVVGDYYADSAFGNTLRARLAVHGDGSASQRAARYQTAVAIVLVDSC